MQMLYEIILAVFAVFGIYCAIIEACKMIIHAKSERRKRKLRFDITSGELYNDIIIIQKESDDAKKRDGK